MSSSRSLAAPGPISRREVLPNGIVFLVAERSAIPIAAVRIYMRGAYMG